MMWHDARKHPGSPPFSGGVLTDWPARAADGFGILNQEMNLIEAYRASLRRKP